MIAPFHQCATVTGLSFEQKALAEITVEIRSLSLVLPETKHKGARVNNGSSLKSMLFLLSFLCFLAAVYGQNNLDEIYDEYPFHLNRVDMDALNKTNNLDEVYSLSYPYSYLPSVGYSTIPQAGHQSIFFDMPPVILVQRNSTANPRNETTNKSQISEEKLKIPVAHKAIASLNNLINFTNSTASHVGNALGVGSIFESNSTADLKEADFLRNNATNSTEPSSQRLPSPVNISHFDHYLFPFTAYVLNRGEIPFTHPYAHPFVF
ncbi:hypothetical protein HNY73_013650 [Argiope bruennichi]|uniref:Uncharacterized protein n=1 Tax=Argiope bruennichi TaxID=94029 RepID=A0A8T0EYQ3_ARGBR|nr:hypothetical protein HNY73_013650 [Argiope bruennichi]